MLVLQMVWLSTVKTSPSKINFCDHIYVDCTLNSPDTLADFVVALGIAASTDEVNERLVMTDDDQLKVFLVLTALSEIAKTSKPSLISELGIIHVVLNNLEMASSLYERYAIESMHNIY